MSFYSIIDFLDSCYRRSRYCGSYSCSNRGRQVNKGRTTCSKKSNGEITSSCRLILLCNSTSKVISAIKCRCLGIRIPAPTIDEVKKLNILNNSLLTRFI